MIEGRLEGDIACLKVAGAFQCCKEKDPDMVNSIQAGMIKNTSTAGVVFNIIDIDE
jgi:hypothetical protein